MHGFFVNRSNADGLLTTHTPRHAHEESALCIEYDRPETMSEGK